MALATIGRVADTKPKSCAKAFYHARGQPQEHLLPKMRSVTGTFPNPFPSLRDTGQFGKFYALRRR